MRSTIAQDILHALGDVPYRWSVADDTLTWHGDVARVLPGVATEFLASGRGWAQLLDRDQSPGGRFDAVLGAPLRDNGTGVPYDITYCLAPYGLDARERIWVQDRGVWFADGQVRAQRAEGVLSIVTDRMQEEQRLTFLSQHDGLTGELNRESLLDTLEVARKRAVEQRQPVAFLVAAIDNMRVINDAYGYAIADEVICQITKRLKTRLRGGDTIGRVSGNKLGLILNECDDQAVQIANKRLLDAVQDEPVETSGGPVIVTLSIGGVILPKHARNVQEGLSRAHEALDCAKSGKHGAFVMYRASPERDFARKGTISRANTMISALNERDLCLAYQPIVHANNGVLHHHECLLRLADENGDFVSCGPYIPIVERLGFAKLVDVRVLELALEDLTAYPDAHLAINVSGATTQTADWLTYLTPWLAQNPASAERLTIEITETAVLSDFDATVEFSGALRALGCVVAIDDFGAGYTSFRHLKHLQAHMVKIDGDFIKNIANDPDNQVFVRSLIAIAKHFEMEIVAEAVQTEEEAALLRAWGVDYFQGFLYGAGSTDKPWHGAEMREPAALAGSQSR